MAFSSANSSRQDNDVDQTPQVKAIRKFFEKKSTETQAVLDSLRGFANLLASFSEHLLAC